MICTGGGTRNIPLIDTPLFSLVADAIDLVGDDIFATQLSVAVTDDLRFGVGRESGFLTGKGSGFLSEGATSFTVLRGDGSLGLLN